MFARDHLKWIRLLVVCVVVLGSSCNGKYTDKVVEVTSSSWPQNGEMGIEVGTDGDVIEVDDPSAEFLAQHGQRNLAFSQLDAGGNTTKITEVENSNQLHLVSGEEREKGVGRKRLEKEAPNGNPASKNDASIFARSLYPTEPEALSYTTYFPGTGWLGSVGGKSAAIQDDELLEGTTTEESSGPFTDNPPLSTLIVNEITTEHVPIMDSSLGEGQEETTFLPSAGASNKPVLRVKPTEFSTLKSTERDTHSIRHFRSQNSTLQPAADKTPFSEPDNFKATTLRKTNENAFISDPSTLSFDTEIITLQTTAARSSTDDDNIISSYEISHSTDPDLNYDNYEDSTESTTLSFASSHTTKQVTVFHTKKTVISATTTFAVTPVTDQTTKQHESTASTNESYSTEPTKSLESNSEETLVLHTATIPITIGLVVVFLAILVGATLCFIQRRNKSKNLSGDNIEQFFMTNNREEEHLNTTFVEKDKDMIIGMYSETELETIEPHELQEKIFNSVAEDGKDGEKPKCLETATKVDPVSGYL